MLPRPPSAGTLAERSRAGKCGHDFRWPAPEVWAKFPTVASPAPSPSAAPSGQRLTRKLLYPTYHRASGINHFLRRRIRVGGIGLLILGVLLTAIAAGRPPRTDISDPIFCLLSFGFCLGVLALVWLPFRHAKLQVERQLPAHATAGEPVPVHYRITNTGRRRVHDAWLTESAPDPRPPLARFLHAREPEEHRRNRFDQLFSWYTWVWLCESRSLFEPAHTRRSLDLRPGESATFSASLLPHRRGIVPLADLRLLMPDPLGFYQRCRRVPAPHDALVVLPRRYPLPPFELPGSARFQPGGDATSRHTGPSGEFVGLREYQPGDPIRLIHWKSWARTGKPIVKELEDTFFPRHGLILDTFPDEGDEDLFEAAVSVAASFAAAIDTQESLIDLMFIAGSERVITAGRGTGRAETLLEALAAVEASPEPQFASLKRLVLRHTEDLAGCLAVFSGWSEERAALLQGIAATGVSIAAIVVCHQVPEKPAPRVHFVTLGDLAADLMYLPGQL